MVERLLSILVVLLVVCPVAAQEVVPVPEEAPEPSPAPETVPVPESPPAPEEESAPEVSREEFEALKAQLAELKTQVEEKEAAEMAEMGAEEFKPSVNIYGFMAMYAGKWFVEEDSPLFGVMNTKLSLAVTDVNVYMAGELTPSLSSLLELRVTFMPHGADQFPSLARIDTTVVNSNTTEEFVLGGVILERAHFTWQPRDWFGVTVGRFLTPFGIWNIDHGAPVVIPVNQPYIILRHLMPLAQTGLYLHGNVFPVAALSLEYGLTVSNGRGPADSMYDVDENKAMGLRLRARYQWSNDVELAVGGYGFIGQKTDDVKVLDVAELQVQRNITEQFWEYAASADLLLKLYGFRIQSEWAGAFVRYDERPPVTIPLLGIQSGTELQPDYLRWDVYVMLAYEWNFQTSYGGMRLTPFVMGERDIMYDNDPSYDAWFLRFGLNFKPHPRFVLKLDTTAGTFPESDMLGDVWSVNGQASVVF